MDRIVQASETLALFAVGVMVGVLHHFAAKGEHFLFTRFQTKKGKALVHAQGPETPQVLYYIYNR